jgi:hypothetical protein
MLVFGSGGTARGRRTVCGWSYSTSVCSGGSILRGFVRGLVRRRAGVVCVASRVARRFRRATTGE